MKKLKAVVHDLVEVPNNLRDYYTARSDGTWEVTLDGEPPGYVPADKLAEFRDNNRDLFRQKTDLEAKLKAFDGFDPDEYRALKARPDLTARVAELESQLAAATTEKTTAQQTADTAVFRAKVADAFLPVGGRPDALDFMITKAQQTFSLQNGQLTTKEFSGTRPGEPLSLTEWVGARILDSAFAFQPSSGGGANGGAKTVTRTISNDPLEFGRNLDAIAKGEITVT
jgi:hypothetical protein